MKLTICFCVILALIMNAFCQPVKDSSKSSIESDKVQQITKQDEPHIRKRRWYGGYGGYGYGGYGGYQRYGGYRSFGIGLGYGGIGVYSRWGGYRNYGGYGYRGYGGYGWGR